MSRSGTTFARRRARPWINCTSFSRRPMQLLRSGSDRPTLMKVRANMVPKVVNGSCLYRTYRRVVVGILCFVLRALGHLFARHDNPPEEFVSFFEITLQLAASTLQCDRELVPHRCLCRVPPGSLFRPMRPVALHRCHIRASFSRI
jgi:hypothetical protein